MKKIMIMMFVAITAFFEIKPIPHQGRINCKKYRRSLSRNSSPSSCSSSPAQADLFQQEPIVVQALPLFEVEPDVYAATIKSSMQFRRINGCKEQIAGVQTIVVDTTMGRETCGQIYLKGFTYAVRLLTENAELMHKDDIVAVHDQISNKAVARHMTLQATANVRVNQTARRNSL